MVPVLDNEQAFSDRQSQSTCSGELEVLLTYTQGRECRTEYDALRSKLLEPEMNVFFS